MKAIADGADADRLQSLGMLASALAGQPVAVAPLLPGEPSWTDGQTVFLDPTAGWRANLDSVAVHASLIAAGSLASEVMAALPPHSRVARRYLAVEGHRALVANGNLLPGVLTSLGDRDVAIRSDSPETSLTMASGRDALSDPPATFGVIRAKKIIAANGRAATQVDHETAGHVPRRESKEALEELDDGEVDDSDDPDLFTRPAGGGGFIGKWLKKLLSSGAELSRQGCGPPGVDAPTNLTNSATGGASAVSSTATTNTEEVADLAVALHDLGDRVALYAYSSQGRTAVNMLPVKRFHEYLDARVIRRLNSLEPGAYSRLGAAIRHGSAVLESWRHSSSAACRPF
jgi:nitric oxide reductase NorD protein